MATFQELIDFNSSAAGTSLRNKVVVAATIKAQAISELPAPSAELKAWARECLADPQSVARILVSYVVADNAGLTVAQITAAADSAIQAAVDKAVDNLFGVA